MARTVRAPLAPSSSATGSLRGFWLGLAVFAATLVAYSPALDAGFIWNDSEYVTAPSLRSSDGFWRIWFELGATEQYYPFLHSAFWLEHKLWGDAPFGYHLVNVLLHATSACLLAGVLWRRVAPKAGVALPEKAGTAGFAWLAAFIFALHPVYVESVAWISEQKNTLSLVFYLIALRLYLRFDAERSPRVYFAATLFFVIGLLTKSVIATLPAALLVLVWWQRGRVEWRRDVRPLLLWFALGAVMGLISMHVEKVYIGAHGSEFELTPIARGLLAGRITWFYLGKLIWPADLIFIYPRWEVDPSQVWQWIFSLAVLVALAVLWSLRRRTRAPLAAALLFGGSLVPTLGFFNVYAFLFSFVADHWQYLPSIAMVVLAAAGIVNGLKRAGASIGVRRAVPALLVVGLGLLSFHQSRMYADMRTFYATTLARNPTAWMAHNNLGNLLRESGDLERARTHYEAALRVRDDLEKVHNNLGNVLREQRRYPDALAHYRRALQVRPEYADAHNNLGSLLRQLGQPAEAIPHFFRALRSDPDFADARNNLGIALRDSGRTAEALGQFQRLVREHPGMSAGHLNLALTLSLFGRMDEAGRHYREARRLNPTIPEIPLN
jgi:tetratricopeptide (TPR) repeat protein